MTRPFGRVQGYWRQEPRKLSITDVRGGSGPNDLERIRRVPLRRPGTPAEVAALAVFLASDASGYISGTVIPIDGGQLAT